MAQLQMLFALVDRSSNFNVKYNKEQFLVVIELNKILKEPQYRFEYFLSNNLNAIVCIR